MILEGLLDFEWLNEPENVVLSNGQMTVEAAANTDFWQSVHHGLKKDNGSFFFKRINGDFQLTLKWSFENGTCFNQCGIMVRADERNWFKSSLLSPDEHHLEIGTCLTLSGHSDWAGAKIKRMPSEIYFKLKRKGDDFVCSYSFDGQKYVQLRQFYLKGADDELKAGAYIAAPQSQPFKAVLKEIAFK